jgi:hypothetical protein
MELSAFAGNVEGDFGRRVCGKRSYRKGAIEPVRSDARCVRANYFWASSLLARPWQWQWQRLLLLPRRWSEFQPGSQRFCREVLCRPLMTMALDVVASLELAMDDAKATNFAVLCCLVRGSVIAGVPRAIRKGSSLIRNVARKRTFPKAG